MNCIHCSLPSLWATIKDNRVKYWCLWPTFRLVRRDSSPGADNYGADPLSYRVSSVQPVHLWALQLSEPFQPHCCEWQLVRRRNLSASKIPSVMSQSPTVPISHLDRKGPSEVDTAVKGVQLALGIAAAPAHLRPYKGRWGFTCNVGNTSTSSTWAERNGLLMHVLTAQ